MKKRILSLLCVAALVLSLAGCALSSSPKTVGTIGETTISSGMYLLSQYQGYFAALDMAKDEPLPEGETHPDYAAMPVKDFLKQTLTVGGAETTGAELVADQTMKNLQYYAAVDASFAALGGELTPEELAQADADAQNIWNGGEELYKKNGFSLATVQEYQYTLHKAADLMDLVYGENGTQAVSDKELQDHLGQDLWFVHSANVPLYNAANFQMTDDGTAKVTEICQKMLDRYNEQREGAESAYDLFTSLAKEVLPEAYTTLENTFTPEAALAPDLLDPSMLESYFSSETADKIRSMKDGDVVMVADSGFTVEFFQLVNPVTTGEWNEELQQRTLFALYSKGLQDGLQEYGESLANGLDTAAMQKLPANKIVPSLG